MTTERIDIIVSERGSRVVRRNLDDIGGSAGTAARGIQFLQRTLAVLGSGLLLRELQQQADTYTLITNRLKLVTSGTENLAAINERLFESAQRTRTSYEATVDLYARVARNASQLGLTQRQLLDITETVNQAIRISGGSAQEAAAGVRQFGQAIGSGALRGDELISVLENMPRLAQAIADGMGVTIGQLRELGADGELTASRIIDALEETAPDIAREFEQLAPTIGEAFTVMSNSALRFIGELDQTLGISQAVSLALIFLADNLDTVARAAAVAGLTLTAAFTVSLIGRAAATVSQVIALERALGATTTASALFSAAMKVGQRAVVGLTAAIAANPIGLLLVALSAVVSYLYVFRDEISVTADGVVSLGDVFRAIFSFIVDVIRPVVEFFRDAWDGSIDTIEGKLGDFLQTVVAVFSAVVGFAKQVVNTQIGLWVGAYKTIVGAWNLFPQAMQAIGAAAVNGLITAVDAGIEAIVQGIGNLFERMGGAFTAVGLDNPFAGMLDGFSTNLEQFMIQGAPEVGATFSQLGGIASREFSEALNTDYLGTLADSIMGRAREIAEARAANTGPLNPTGEIPGDPGIGDVPGVGTGSGSGSGSADLPDHLQRMKDMLEEIEGPLDTYEGDLAALNSLMEAGAITAEEYAAKWQDIRLAFLDTQTTLEAGLERSLIRLGQELSDMASMAEDVVTNAFGNMEDALVDFVKTGKLDFSKFVDSLIEDIARLVIRYYVMRPIIQALSSFMGIPLGFATGGDFAVPSFATGGDFMVGGQGGVDSVPVSFMATPGERVRVYRPGQMERSQGGAAAASGNVQVNVYSQGGEVETKERSGANGDKIVDVFIGRSKSSAANDIAQGGTDLNRAIESRYGLNPAGGNQR